MKNHHAIVYQWYQYYKYYPQTLLEKCKYEQKKIKIENLIYDDLEKRLSDSEPDNNYND